jgi:hypothetical protein
MPLYSSYEDDEVNWVWDQALPEAEVWGLVGPSNVGKRLFTCDVVSRISRGWPMPPIDPLDPTHDGTKDNSPGYCIMIHPEDKNFVVKASLKAAGADLDMIDNMTYPGGGTGGGSASDTFIIQRDLPRLAKRVKELGDVRMIIIDPLMASTVKTVAFNLQLRQHTINPLQRFAEEYGPSMGLVHHFNKGVKLDRLEDSINGSAGFVQALRVTNIIMPGDPDPDVKVFSNLNSNIGETGVKFAEYRIFKDGMNTRLRWKLPPLEIDAGNKDTLEAHILAMLIDARRPISTQEMATYLDLSHSIVRQMVAKAAREGKLEKVRGKYVPAAAIEAAATREITF